MENLKPCPFRGMTLDDEKLQEILKSHKLWLDNAGGVRADLNHADLNHADLKGTNLSYANLNHADLKGTNLNHANLSHANLNCTNLIMANLNCTNLSGTNLSYADLTMADLKGTNLSHANLSHANLSGTNLRGTNLSGTKLSEKIIQVGTIGSRDDYTVYFVDRDVVQCGCWNEYSGGSLEQFKARVDEVYPDGRYRREYLAAIELFDAMREIYTKGKEHE